MVVIKGFDDVCRHFDIEGYGRDQLEENMMFLRRSTRQRKYLYGTFDQSLMLDAPLVQSVEQDKPDEEKETRQQQTVLQQQSDVQPPSDAEVAVDTV